MAVDPALIPAVRASAQRLGINPSDLLTAMSYETGGTLNPNLWGGKNNQYLGLIQFGPGEQQKYGVKPGMPVADQVTAAENFLRDRGVRPGMGMLDIYSTINAGSPGLYNRSDANNGGAPGTIYDKVTQQMAGHRARAESLLGLQPGQDQGTPLPLSPPVNVGASAQPASPLNLMSYTGAPPTMAGQPMPLFGQPAQQPAQPTPQQAPAPASLWSMLAPPSDPTALANFWARQNPTG